MIFEITNSNFKVIDITLATTRDFQTISNIAYRTWPSTYGHILSSAQLSYMLDLFYSIDGLNKNTIDGHQFLLAKENNLVLGFASYIHDYPEKGTTKIPKIYMLPESQGKGIGKLMVQHVAGLAKENGSKILTLNVNRCNKALGFYQNLGFAIAGEEDIKLDHGYLMEDYIMEKRLP